MNGKIVTDNFDFLFKLVVIGDSGVGKTNLLSRFSTNEFTQQSKPTIGVEFATKTLQLDHQKIKAQIWDTAGQQRFRAITHAYYKGATGALLVFDITRRSSYQNLPKWLKQLKENAEENIVCILVAEERCIKQEEVVDFAQENKLYYLQTSALQSTNVEKAFMTVIKEIFEQTKTKEKTEEVSKKKLSPTPSPDPVVLSRQPAKPVKKCCL